MFTFMVYYTYGYIHCNSTSSYTYLTIHEILLLSALKTHNKALPNKVAKEWYSILHNVIGT